MENNNINLEQNYAETNIAAPTEEKKEIKAEISHKLSILFCVYFGILGAAALCITFVFAEGLLITLGIFFLGVGGWMIFCGFPLLIAIRKSEMTELTVSANEAYGSYTAFIPVAMITLKMPINKIDNVSYIKSVFHIFGGKTIVIRSTSAKIKIPYVKNADEVVAFISEAIERAKKGNTVESQSATSRQDAADSIKKLAELRDLGLITEDEFNQKKNDLLSKL